MMKLFIIAKIHCGCFLQINFVLTSAYTSMVDQMGFHGTFWLYASFSAVSAVFIAICVPETRNKTDEQIAKFFEWKSCCYKSQSCATEWTAGGWTSGMSSGYLHKLKSMWRQCFNQDRQTFSLSLMRSPNVPFLKRNIKERKWPLCLLRSVWVFQYILQTRSKSRDCFPRPVREHQLE